MTNEFNEFTQHYSFPGNIYELIISIIVVMSLVAMTIVYFDIDIDKNDVYSEKINVTSDALSQFSSPVTFTLISIGVICVSLILIVCLIKYYLCNDLIKEDEVNE